MKKSVKLGVFLLFIITLLTFTACNKKDDSSSIPDTDDTSASETESQFSTEIPDVEDVILNPSNGNYIDQLAPPTEGETIAIIETNMGKIKIRFFEEFTPKAVENFITHAKDGYYDGVIFHRVLEEFMIQGGDPQGDGYGGESIWGAPFEDEFAVYLNNIRGALCMANSGPNTNGSQFFIVQGHPTSGMWEAIDSNVLLYLQEMQYDPRQVPTDIRQKYTDNGGAMWLDGAFRTYGGHTVFGQVFYGMDVVDKIASVKTIEKTTKPAEDVTIVSIKITTYGSEEAEASEESLENTESLEDTTSTEEQSEE